MNFDKAEIERTLKLFFEPGEVREMRVPETKRDGTVSGYFDSDHLAEGTKAAAQWSGQAPGVYILPNPCKSELHARAYNCVKTHVKKPRRAMTSSVGVGC
ncbi:MAG: hypothetical protein EXR70_23780 [Deltaproteobacteria bacterium]|nr:hypothetical protein [Deltaproteobacteria bacterium]